MLPSSVALLRHLAAEKVRSTGLLDRRAPRVGIVGFGAIGRAVAVGLSDNTAVSVYDYSSTVTRADDVWTHVSSLDSLLDVSDVCTGTDCLRRVPLERVTGKKIFVSGSSSDTEFLSLLNIAGFPTRDLEPQLFEYTDHSKYQSSTADSRSTSTATPNENRAQIFS